MSMRRQGFEWSVADLGNLPPKRLAELETPQSVFYSQLGSATLKNRQRTSDDEYLVINYFGSTPGIYGTGNDWVPGGYVNFTIGTTSYFTNPDGLPGPGVTGDAQPYPITTQTSPVFVGSYGIEIPPDTDWDFKYFLSNAFVEPVEDYDGTPFSWANKYFTPTD